MARIKYSGPEFRDRSESQLVAWQDFFKR